jgi:Flp pilus assembly protein TadD
MRTLPLALLLLGGAAGCSNGDAEVARGPSDPLAVLEADAVGEVMLAVAQPEEAVAHFGRLAAARPGDAGAKRGLATALMRARRHEDAARVLAALAEEGQATPADRVVLVEALIRTEEWPRAREVMAEVPHAHRTEDRFRLEAMLADVDGAWGEADGHYEAAVALSAAPAGVLNNWGFSKLSRGDRPGAERLFERALAADPALFAAKNNLAMARGARGAYEVPLVPMTQTERATVLHTLALAAVKAGDLEIGRTLLHDAVETHPRHFEPAARALAALEAAPAGARGATLAGRTGDLPEEPASGEASAGARAEARLVAASAPAGEPFP